MRVWCSVFLVIAASCGAPPKSPAVGPTSTAPASSSPEKPEVRLRKGWAAFRGSAYAEAQQAFQELRDASCCGASAKLGLTEIAFVQGRYADAVALAGTVPRGAHHERAVYLKASALQTLGERAAAEATLNEALRSLPPEETRSLRVAAAELMIGRGGRAEAEPVLLSLIEEYNSDVIQETDGEAMLWVARAVALLRSPEDANDAYNASERALGHDQRLLLARAQLFLDNYDPGHAEEVLSELLEAAPAHPAALTLMAEVRLDQALDFGEAKELARRALRTNPNLWRAHFILAGLSLRDMQLEEARQHVQRGLDVNVEHLELLSMAGAIEFLADEREAFEKLRGRVLELNPEYSRFYQIVGDFADWEHRYDEIVQMMREAVAVDPYDAKAQAQLGINLIRSGDEQRGVTVLQRAYSQDPFNVRVVNTLNLYERVIPTSYVSEASGNFVFRYPKEEKAILARYLPALMERAWSKMREDYQFTPSTPVGIELYNDRSHFAIRTSGLPQIAIQGVCFGKTLASMSPRAEKFNVGMTLWHELAHVFHIQLSKAHVPRWFTEGLAEYETAVERTEWKRERDAELYRALKAGKVPKIGSMNEAFTHAENLSDVAVAYYASTQVVTMLAEQFGRAKLPEMLAAWGEGKRTEEVLQRVLGVSSTELDQRFATYLKQRLKRFDGQFMPSGGSDDIDRVRRRVNDDPKDADARAALGRFFLEQGDLSAAEGMVKLALAVDEKHAQALWLGARIATVREDTPAVLAAVGRMVRAGHNGYEVQLLKAKALDQKKQAQEVSASLNRAHEFDPEAAEPLYGLLQLAAASGDTASELSLLRKLAALEEHDGGAYRRIVELLTESGEHEAAVSYGEAALYVDLESPKTHLVLAQALAGASRDAEAEREFHSALACPGPSSEVGEAHQAFAEFLTRRGRGKEAGEHRARALELASGRTDE